MIVTVTLNPAVDVTYRTTDVRLGSSHRVTHVAQRAGGKGVNVSRVLSLMGHKTVATGLAGGATGRLITAELDTEGIPSSFALIAGSSRRTVTVVEPNGQATTFNEPGPSITETEWIEFERVLAKRLDSADVLVLSGSVPPGSPVDGYAALLTAAHDHGVPTILDAEGPTLSGALGARPTVVKPNVDELRTTTGIGDVAAAARELHDRGAHAVVVSLGPDGIFASTSTGTIRLAAPPCPVRNPTGAGDAAVAAIATGLAERLPWTEVIRRAVAWSAAAVSEPLGGAVDPRVVRNYLDVLGTPEESH